MKLNLTTKKSIPLKLKNINNQCTRCMLTCTEFD